MGEKYNCDSQINTRQTIIWVKKHSLFDFPCVISAFDEF